MAGINNGAGINNAPDPTASSETQPVPDFDVSLSSPLLTVLVGAGGSGFSTITITPSNGFTGDVVLTASGPGGITASANPSVVTLGLAQTSGLSVSVPPGTPAGIYPVTVTGTSGPLSHSAVFTVNVSDFSLSIAPTALTVPAGSSRSAAVYVNGIYGFSASVGFTVTGLPAGAGVSFSPSSVSGSGSSTATFSAGVNTPPGTYPITITGTCGSLTRTTSLSLTVVDFSLSVTPTTVTIPVGGTGSATVTVTGIAGFTGSVGLSASGQPSGVSAVFAPTSVTATGTSTLTFTADSSAVPGSYPITISGTYGGATLTTSMTLNVTDFTLSATPSTLSLSPGGSKSSVISMTPLYGFTGSVALSVTGAPAGMTASLSSASISAGSPSTLTVSTLSSLAQSSYTLRVFGTANGHFKSVDVVVKVSDPVVTVTIGSLQDVFTGIPVTTTATASVDPLPGGYSASQLVATWSYSTAYLVYSATGNDETWIAPGDGSTASVTLNGADTSPAGTFSATLNTEGYYEACIGATVSFRNPVTGQTFGPYTGYGFASNDGYVSSAAVKPAGISPSLSPSGVAPALSPAGAPATTGKPKVKAKRIISIYSGSTPVTETTINCYAGQKISLSALAPASISNGQWYIAPAGVAISSYTDTTPLGQVTSMAQAGVAQKLINFYFTGSGNHIEVRYGGLNSSKQYVHASVYFNVQKPVANIAFNTPSPSLDYNVRAYMYKGKRCLGLGDLSQGKHGIDFNATFPNGLMGGTMKWVQLITYYQCSVDSQSVPALDGGNDYNANIGLPNSGFLEDSPCQYWSGLFSNTLTVSKKMYFVDWLMWTPPGGGIYVPLATVGWGWGGSAGGLSFGFGSNPVPYKDAPVYNYNASGEPQWSIVAVSQP